MKKLLLGGAALLSLMMGSAPAQTGQTMGDSGAASANLTTFEQKFSYMIGVQLAQDMDTTGIKLDSRAVALAIRDFQAGNQLAVRDKEADDVKAEFQKRMDAKQAEMQKQSNSEADTNSKAADKFMAENKAKEGVKATASGLQYEVEKEGAGDPPKPESTVKVNYRGTLIDGTEFDSTMGEGGVPAEFEVDRVIPGWTEGLQLMKPGAKYKFYIPPGLAYGAQAYPGIPPNSALIFEVELIEVKAAE